jgi:DNA-directed RNA polymerase subunit RPC12/RpoP
MLLYNCDACGAHFEVDPDNKPEFGVFCPECGETEIIKLVQDQAEACETENANEGQPRRG